MYVSVFEGLKEFMLETFSFFPFCYLFSARIFSGKRVWEFRKSDFSDEVGGEKKVEFFKKILHNPTTVRLRSERINPFIFK